MLCPWKPPPASTQRKIVDLKEEESKEKPFVVNYGTGDVVIWTSIASGGDIECRVYLILMLSPC